MEPLTIGCIGFAAFVALIFLRVPIAYAMAIVGTLGLLSVYDVGAVFKFVPFEMFSQTSSFTLASLPLFLLMGYLAYYADLAGDSYEAAKAWFGRVPGGLAVGTVYACAIFGACSGSSLATCGSGTSPTSTAKRARRATPARRSRRRGRATPGDRANAQRRRGRRGRPRSEAWRSGTLPWDTTGRVGRETRRSGVCSSMSRTRIRARSERPRRESHSPMEVLSDRQ